MGLTWLSRLILTMSLFERLCTSDIARFGDASINSSIGSQWKTRVVPLHLKVQEIIDQVSSRKATKIYMNVKLNVVRR